MLAKLFWLLGCAAPESTESLALTPCHIEGVDEETLCGVVEVPEDRDAPQGKHLSLDVVVLPAIRPNPLPDPVFFLAGGPGQAATETIPPILAALAYVHRSRDLIFVDQRGTKGAHKLFCKESIEDSLEFISEDQVKSCLEELTGDPRLYTTEQAILDFEAVRVALGSPLLNLVGGSYGTRAALSWMRMFPDSLRSVVLDSVAPPQIPLFLYFGQDAEASWKQLAADCEKQPACHQTFPDPTEELQQLLASLPKASSTPDPTTGELLEGEWTRLKVLSAVRAALYSPELSALLPLAIRQANQGDFAPLSAMLLGFSSSVKIADGLLLSVVCTEDLPRITEAPSSLLFGNDALSFMQQTCTLWPKGLPARDHAAPVVSSIPTLLLSGLGDPVTPPRQAQEAAATLSHSKVLVAPGAAHIVMGRGCSASLLKNFINAASVEGLKESCVEDIERPPFFVDRLGPVND